eukprot:GFUD01113322.1.p1 GENE.GFUD01113322.1~~GFUD01113322.1.p1  ORF type:complete len:272 (-),score=98.26 GFUD01113322.1:118-882(-)
MAEQGQDTQDGAVTEVLKITEALTVPDAKEANTVIETDESGESETVKTEEMIEVFDTPEMKVSASKREDNSVDAEAEGDSVPKESLVELSEESKASRSSIVVPEEILVTEESTAKATDEVPASNPTVDSSRSETTDEPTDTAEAAPLKTGEFQDEVESQEMKVLVSMEVVLDIDDQGELAKTENVFQESSLSENVELSGESAEAPKRMEEITATEESTAYKEGPESNKALLDDESATTKVPEDNANASHTAEAT